MLRRSLQELKSCLLPEERQLSPRQMAMVTYDNLQRLSARTDGVTAILMPGEKIEIMSQRGSVGKVAEFLGKFDAEDLEELVFELERFTSVDSIAKTRDVPTI